MKILLISIFFLTPPGAKAQFHTSVLPKPYVFHQAILVAPKKTFIPGLLADPAKSHYLSSPSMLASSSYDWRMQGSFFWTGTVTSQSFNKGRFGTYYYWDLQGNLRGARGFIDLSGKNRRGWKLVFPWR